MEISCIHSKNSLLSLTDLAWLAGSLAWTMQNLSLELLHRVLYDTYILHRIEHMHLRTHSHSTLSQISLLPLSIHKRYRICFIISPKATRQPQ